MGRVDGSGAVGPGKSVWPIRMWHPPMVLISDSLTNVCNTGMDGTNDSHHLNSMHWYEYKDEDINNAMARLHFKV